MPEALRPDGTHVFPLRVYYEDTDAGGVVYHANYLRFAERARSEMLRALGIPHTQMLRDDGLAWTVSRCEVDFVRPARLDDALEVHSRLLEIGGASLWAEQIVRRDKNDCARLKLRLACVDGTGRPARLPDSVRGALARKTSAVRKRA
jgi:acyl-CoA thioester hydrolase